MESQQVHMGAVICRDLSCVVSNYRANMTLDDYLKQQKVRAGLGVLLGGLPGGLPGGAAWGAQRRLATQRGFAEAPAGGD